MARICHRCGAPCNDTDQFCVGCGSAVSGDAAVDPMVGRTVAEAYVLQELIAVGGMGRVYRAEQRALGRTVAVKLIHPHLLGVQQTVARFYTEARAASRLNHPNSVGIIDFGRTPDGVLYLVMEYLDGRDLAVVMYEDGPLPVPRICDILMQVLAALAEAHAIGVVHRDLKPENILLKRLRSGSDLVKVVDFGLATILGNEQPSITQPGMVCGTPDYMSPEQGRGDPLDGRSDLYSLGVVLFELLTEKLPFEADTPTKVLLRHINDAVPDPRRTAPHREIPDVLAEIAMKAMSKAPEARFQAASEFEATLRRAVDGLRAKRADVLVCPSCGAENPGSMRFCGSCATRLSGPFSLPPPAVPAELGRVSFYPAPRVSRPVVGRAEELARLDAARRGAGARAAWLHLVGDPGVGKTRLLDEVAELAADDGDFVVGGRPDPSHAPVPYAAVRPMLAALLGVDAAGLRGLAEQDPSFDDLLLREGLSEIIEAVGLAGTDGASRVSAVVRLARVALRRARGKSRTGRVVLLVDDLHLCDGLSVELLRGLAADAEVAPLFILTAGTDRPEAAASVEVVPVGGLELAGAAELALGVVPLEGFEAAGMVSPLLIEQLVALGPQLDATSVPRRTGDAIAQRVERLALPARRLLQAAAVLGDACREAELRGLADERDMAALGELEQRKLLERREDELVFSHPLIREVVEGSIPSEARRELHDRAFSLAAEHSAPLEVRAEHAYRGSEAMSAMMLLERMGDLARSRGDTAAAVLGFRRGLELARRELVQTGDPSFDAVIVTFSRKLGDALDRAGHIAGADGVLREALDLTGPATKERAHMLVALGRVAARRERHRDAHRLLGQALDVSTRLGDAALEASVHAALGRVRRQEGDTLGAANAFRRASELYGSRAGTPGERARALVELAEVLADLGETDDAAATLDRAFEFATEAHAPALAASALGLLGTIDELAGDSARAHQRYADAARYAALAGDAPAHDRWHRAARVLAAT